MAAKDQNTLYLALIALYVIFVVVIAIVTLNSSKKVVDPKEKKSLETTSIMTLVFSGIIGIVLILLAKSIQQHAEEHFSNMVAQEFSPKL